MAESGDSLLTAGQLLGAARRERGLELPALAAATRISEQFLTALEADEHDVLPPLYIRSFVRAYAAALGLSADEVLARLDSQAGGSAPAAGSPPVWEQEVTVKRVDGGGSRLWLRWAVVAVAAVAVVFVAVRLLDHSGRRAFGPGLGPADSLAVRVAPAAGVVPGEVPAEVPSSGPGAADSSLTPDAAGGAFADTSFAPRP
ncbi:MAG: helix-turn-helix domain-containing protein [Candidatus Krumholzibacteriia bacterium]